MPTRNTVPASGMRSRSGSSLASSSGMAIGNGTRLNRMWVFHTVLSSLGAGSTRIPAIAHAVRMTSRTMLIGRPMMKPVPSSHDFANESARERTNTEAKSSNALFLPCILSPPRPDSRKKHADPETSAKTSAAPVEPCSVTAMDSANGNAFNGDPEAEFPVKTAETRRHAERASMRGSC